MYVVLLDDNTCVTGRALEYDEASNYLELYRNKDECLYLPYEKVKIIRNVFSGTKIFLENLTSKYNLHGRLIRC